MILWLHPLGAWYVLIKKNGSSNPLPLYGDWRYALIGFNMLNVDILLTSPIAYLGHIGAGLNTVILNDG